MAGFMSRMEAFFQDYFNLAIPEFTATDVVEILIIAFFFYELLAWVRHTRAWLLMRGIVIIVAFFILAALLRMSTILWLGERLISVGVTAIVVVFQPELRNGLEKLGRGSIFRSIRSLGLGRAEPTRFSDKTIHDLVRASFEMGAVKTGALIVVEEHVVLSEYVETGIELDSLLSSQLLINIFEKNTPLHDGAVIVRGDRVVAATCYLPLTDNSQLSKDLGTRHRAAVGISEVSDSLTIVVSEETGKVSVAREGKLSHDLNQAELLQMLHEMQVLARKEEQEKLEEGA